MRTHSARVAQELLSERIRQVEAKGYTAEHDDETHVPAHLAHAAASYALSAAETDTGAVAVDIEGIDCAIRGKDLWPWPDGFNSKSARSDLVKAGALIIAAIEMVDRRNEREAAEPC